jgi:Flp pilus assembly protein TadD
MVVCAFAPVLKNGFIYWDDPHYVSENVYLRSITPANVKALLTSVFVGTYQPVVNITYLLERSWFGCDASVYHATNLLLHTLNCLLVFWLVILWDGNILVALLTALLFGLHPLRVESVAWVSERKDVLYSFFFLWALADYCRYVKNNAGREYYRSFFLFFLSLGSKAMAAVLPLVFFAVDYLFKRRFDKKLILEKAPFFMLSLIFGVIAVVAQGKALGVGHGEKFALPLRLGAPLYGSIMYLWKTVFPAKLSVIYPYPALDGRFFLICLTSAVLLSLICWAAVRSARYSRKTAFSLLFALITVAPVLQLIPVGKAIMADRYTYLPSIGISYLASVWFFRLYGAKKNYGPLLRLVLAVLLVVALTVLSVLTYNRTHIWKNSVTYDTDAINNYPDSYVSYNNRGIAYYKMKKFTQALSDYNKSLQLNDKQPIVYCNRGVIYQEMGDQVRAIEDFTKALKLNPSYSEVYNNLGNSYAAIGKKGEAKKAYAKAIELNPKYAEAYNNLGTECSDPAEAIKAYKKAIEINPDYAEAYYNLSKAYEKTGMIEEAGKFYRKAKKLKPDLP